MDPDGSDGMEDMADDSVCPSRDDGENSSPQQQGKRFDMVDLKHAPVEEVESTSRDSGEEE